MMASEIRTSFRKLNYYCRVEVDKVLEYEIHAVIVGKTSKTIW